MRCASLPLSPITAHNLQLQETHVQVAIKTVRRDNLSAKLFENLQSEIQILKALSHRHITKLTDIVVRISYLDLRMPNHYYSVLNTTST